MLVASDLSQSDRDRLQDDAAPTTSYSDVVALQSTDYDRGHYGHRPQIDRRYDHDNRYTSRAYQRELRLYRWRLAQWRQEQQRRRYWEQQRRDSYDWRYDYDD